jgi:PAS domain S-box-containing protein
MLLATDFFCVSAATPERILIIDSFGRDIAPFNSAVSTFRTTIARELGKPVDIYEASLDAARFAEPEREPPFVDFLKFRFEGRALDLVVPIGAPAVRFVSKYRDTLFPSVPVVFTGVDPRLLPNDALKTNTTLVTQRVNLPGMVEDILQLQPSTTNIVVIFGASPLEKIWESECRREFGVFTNRVSFTWLNELSLDAMIQRVAVLPPNAFILFGMLVTDATGVPYDNDEALRRIHAAANAPVFGYFASQFGIGAIGGRLYQDAEVGRRAAVAAIRILGGERPEGMPVQILEGAAPVYDWRELKRWNVSEERLPPGSLVEFREPPAWKQYTWHIVVVALLFVIGALLILVLLTNLTKRRRAEMSLMDNQNRLRAILDTAVEGIITINEQGVIESVNAATERIFGYGAGELVGQNCSLLMPQPYRDEHDQYIRNYHRTQTPKIIGIGREVSGRRQDGSVFPLDLSVSEVVLPDRRIFTGFVRDLSLQKQAEMKAVELRENLAHLGRVNTLGALSSSLAHELNQPLGIILSNAQAAQELLTQEPPDLVEVQAILTDIVAADRRAGEVIEGLRSMLKRGQAKMEPISVNEIIEQVLHLIRADLINRGVTFTLDLQANLPTVAGDRIQLQQVLLNLLLNASDAMAENAPGKRRLEIRTALADDRVRASIRDEGGGLPAEVDRLFQPFYTTKSHGLGMGLAICRTIVGLHQGRLWAEPHPERGAVFIFELPLS